MWQQYCFNSYLNIRVVKAMQFIVCIWKKRQKRIIVCKKKKYISGKTVETKIESFKLYL